MFEIYENIIKIIFDLSSRGINIISIIITILLVHAIKTILKNFQLYNDKTSSIINIIVGIIISFIIAFILYSKQFSIYNISITAVIGASVSVYSREIMDAAFKFLKKEK